MLGSVCFLTESMQKLGERGCGFDLGLLFDLHPGMQRLPIRWVGMDSSCNPESKLDDKSFLLNHTCGITAPLSVSWPWLYISTILHHQYFSTKSSPCISSGTSSASSRARVPMSARAAVQEKCCEREGGKADPQDSKREAGDHCRTLLC